MLDLWCCAGAFSSSASVGYSLVAELGLFIAGASLVAPGLWGARASVVVAQGLSCSAARGIFPDQGWNLSPLY